MSISSHLRTSAICLFALAAGMPSSAAPTARATKLRMTDVTGLPSYSCSARDGSPPFCEDVQFEVQAFPIKSPDGIVRGCVAYMPYSALTVNTLKKGLATTITWVSSDSNVAFDKGITLEAVNVSDKISDLFDKLVVTDTQVTLPVKAGVKLKKKFKHLPSVTLNIGGGNIIPCDGADPLISNSPN